MRQTLNFQDLQELVIAYPDKEEQKKIADFFDSIDSIISEHQGELEKLKNIKQSLLYQLFPQDNSNVPLLRFKGFNQCWENAKLNEFLTVSTEKNSEDKYKAEGIFSVSGEYGIVNQIEFQGRSFEGASLLGYRVIHPNEIAYTKSPLKSNPFGIIKTNKDVSGIVSALYGVYKTKDVYPNFVQVYFDLPSRLNSYLRPLVNKGPKNTLLITDEGAISGSVLFPKIDEQKKISNLIDKLTKLILLKERQLTLLKHSKQALLEQMFVNN